jgi:hypothetical protein
MKFIIVFYYMDGETFELEVHPNDMETFMACLGKGEVFFNDARGVGVWIPVDKVRYFQLEKVDGTGKRVTSSCTEVQGENGRVEEGGACPSVEGIGGMESALQATKLKSQQMSGPDRYDEHHVY